MGVGAAPARRRLAYRGQDEGGRERIFVRAVEGGGTGSAVSPADIDVRGPAWSPDGATLAFATYNTGRPCRLYLVRPGGPASAVGGCETARDPYLAWSSDGRSLLFTDATGWNVVPRISEVRLADGHRGVVTNPPGDSMGDELPLPLGNALIFQREDAWADQGWVTRDAASERERLLWRRRGLAGSAAAALPDGSLAVAWTRASTAVFDTVAGDGRVRSTPLAAVQVTAVAAAGTRLLIETDHQENEARLATDRDGQGSSAPLVAVRGHLSSPLLLPGGRLRFPVVAAGLARICETDGAGGMHLWGSLVAARIAGLSQSPDGRFTAAQVTAHNGREVVLLDVAGRPVYRSNPHARSVNPPAWSSDGHRLIVAVLDGGGWRLIALDPFGGGARRDLGLAGFALLQARGPALYAVRAGEAIGIRELWRLDGGARRLPIDLTLFDIANWRAVDDGIWLPDRSDRKPPRLVLRDFVTGRVRRTVVAPGLAGAGSELTADARGPVYVRTTRDAHDYALLTLTLTR